MLPAAPPPPRAQLCPVTACTCASSALHAQCSKRLRDGWHPLTKRLLCPPPPARRPPHTRSTASCCPSLYGEVAAKLSQQAVNYVNLVEHLVAGSAATMPRQQTCLHRCGR